MICGIISVRDLLVKILRIQIMIPNIRTKRKKEHLSTLPGAVDNISSKMLASTKFPLPLTNLPLYARSSIYSACGPRFRDFKPCFFSSLSSWLFWLFFHFELFGEYWIVCFFFFLVVCFFLASFAWRLFQIF